MQRFDVFLLITMFTGVLMWFWALHDLSRAFFIHGALVRSLAGDAEFLRYAPHIWECAQEDQVNNEKFMRLRAIIIEHIERLRFRWPKGLPWPLSRAQNMRLSHVQALVGAVEKRLQRQTQ